MLPAPRQDIPTGPQVRPQQKSSGEDPNNGYGSPEAAAAADRLLQLGVTVNPPGKSGVVDWGALAGVQHIYSVIKAECIMSGACMHCLCNSEVSMYGH